MLLDLDRGAAVSAGDCGFSRRMVSVSTRRIRCCGYVEPDRIADMNVEPPALVRGIGGEFYTRNGFVPAGAGRNGS